MNSSTRLLLHKIEECKENRSCDNGKQVGEGKWEVVVVSGRLSLNSNKPEAMEQ